MPEIEQVLCPKCRHMERPDWICDICNGIGYYSPPSQILKSELIGLLNWLELNYGGESNEEKVNSYINSTERYE